MQRKVVKNGYQMCCNTYGEEIVEREEERRSWNPLFIIIWA